jgi:NTP pyrophosphatase (non-canonical NTP hydrolase)
MKQHIDNILRWAADRGLLQNDPRVQCLKTVSEVGELADNIAKGRHHHAKDDIGDIIVTLVILAAQLGTDLDECTQIAWDEIKNRKGKTVNGVFIKESDVGH